MSREPTSPILHRVSWAGVRRGHVAMLVASHTFLGWCADVAMLVALLEHPAFASTDLSSAKAICSGGSTVPAALVTRMGCKRRTTRRLSYARAVWCSLSER